MHTLDWNIFNSSLDHAIIEDLQYSLARVRGYIKENTVSYRYRSLYEYEKYLIEHLELYGVIENT